MANRNQPPRLKKGSKSSTLFLQTRELIGPAFELEALEHTNIHIKETLPGCNISAMEQHHVTFDEEECQLDSLAYLTKDEGIAGDDCAKSGIKVISIDNDVFVEPKKGKRNIFMQGKISTSPTAKVRCVHGALKYLIGEMCFSLSKQNAKNKVKQLEINCRILVARFNCKNDENIDALHVTSVIGAAYLTTLSRQSKKRSEELKLYEKYVMSTLSVERTPYLWHLAQSRRLFVVVLSTAETPRATAIINLQNLCSEMYVDISTVVNKLFQRQEKSLKRIETDLRSLSVSFKIFALLSVFFALLLIGFLWYKFSSFDDKLSSLEMNIEEVLNEITQGYSNKEQQTLSLGNYTNVKFQEDICTYHYVR